MEISSSRFGSITFPIEHRSSLSSDTQTLTSSLLDFSTRTIFLRSPSSSPNLRRTAISASGKQCLHTKPRLLTREDILTPGKENPGPIPYTPSKIRAEILKEMLQKAFDPVELTIQDITKNPIATDEAGLLDEHRFDIFMVSTEYQGISHQRRHQRIYHVLKEELHKGIDELLVIAITPAEKEYTDNQFAELEKKWYEEAKQGQAAFDQQEVVPED